ncbi:putative glycoside hydrolase [Vibrio sp. B1FLJ16]|uniref:putative glycoside hydrolase n=1 Tax=Vibrio sp. B1FLJ16 TaxID=2751178 RepID=UPI0015F37060|nr:putative glycoside hydrolase [Vibrio sp. B1FLJ16]CAD7813006.1 hypothetical protein ACOMICROBIO_EPCKBFOG_02604 [Vibrio sp. B1FLJ16]CAE6920300.1 hypothetical protein ACOMICROBIO_EPCKBFOG_02604 [Vibrio sp. B1FLJ16]
MKKANNKIIYLPLLPLAMAISGCNLSYDETQPEVEVPTGSELKLFGVEATAGTTAWAQSVADSYATLQITETPPVFSDIDAVLISNKGEYDTASVQFKGTDTGHAFMVKGESNIDLSTFQNGYLEFDIRTSNAPSSMSVSIDNSWPNRRSFEFGGDALTAEGAWETLSIPVNCLKLVEGGEPDKVIQVEWPFRLDVSEQFDFEITDVVYRSTTTNKSIDCGSASTALKAVLYYSGDIGQAVDYSSAYPLESFGFSVEVDNKVVHVSENGENGGVFLGDDDVTNNENFSAYKDDYVSLDLKVTSYGASSHLELRMDGEQVDYGTNFAINSGMLPADDQWYRCQIPVLAMIPEGNLSAIEKAIYISGVWDSMSGLDFSFANVSIEGQSDSYDAESPCIKL